MSEFMICDQSINPSVQVKCTGFRMIANRGGSRFGSPRFSQDALETAVTAVFSAHKHFTSCTIPFEARHAGLLIRLDRTGCFRSVACGCLHNAGSTVEREARAREATPVGQTATVLSLSPSGSEPGHIRVIAMVFNERSVFATYLSAQDGNPKLAGYQEEPDWQRFTAAGRPYVHPFSLTVLNIWQAI